MKRILLKLAFFMLAFATVFIACKESIFEMADNSMNVEEAQAWYKANVPDLLVLKSGNTQQQPKVVKPDWNNAFKSKNNQMEVVETSLLSNGGFGFATEESHCAWETSKNDGYLTSLPRLVIMRDKKSKETVSFIMTIVGDKPYLEKNKFRLWQNSYLTKDKDFSGLVLFHNLEGTFVNGWQYTNGEPTHTVAMNTGSDFPIHLKSTSYDCTTYIFWGIYQNCVTSSWISLGETGSYTQCGAPYVSYGGSYTVCSNTGATVTGGGYSPSASYSPRANDKFCKPELEYTMTPQMPNTCVTSIMAYIEHQFCGGSINEGVYMTDYANTFGKYVPVNGVDLIDIQQFVDRHFNTTDYISWQQAIDDGLIIMTDVGSSIPNSTHNVAVIGYNPDGKLIYMDPETGTLEAKPASDFNASAHYAIAIESCK